MAKNKVCIYGQFSNNTINNSNYVNQQEKGKNKDKKNKKAEKKAQAAIEQENEGISDPEINEKVELEEDPIKSNEKIIESMKETGSDGKNSKLFFYFC